MAYQDSNPERRNLIVTSIALSAYCYAGGSIAEPSIRLQFINATFSLPGVLALIGWLVLFWFIYRYWLAHNGDFSKSFREEFHNITGKQYLTNFMNQCIGQSPIQDDEEGYRVSGLAWWKNCVTIQCRYYLTVNRDPNGRIVFGTPTSAHKETPRLLLNNFKGWILTTRITVDCMIKKPNSSYLFPYILALVAILGGLWRLLST